MFFGAIVSHSDQSVASDFFFWRVVRFVIRLLYMSRDWIGVYGPGGMERTW